jgi:putative membrane protein
MRILVWLFRAFLFFTLFAFALNNLHTATINWFFGVRWNAPLVIVVLVAFGAGCALGVLAMVPAWWKHRRRSRQAPATEAAAASTTAAAAAADFVPEHPPREGL